MKKILVLAESLRINETSSGIVSSTFIQLLCETGFNVKVITPQNFSYPIDWLPGIEIQRFEIPNSNISFLDYIPKVRALPTYWYGYGKKFRALIRKWIAVTQEEISKNEFDYIYVLGSGSEFAPHFAMAQIDTSIPWIANFHDPFPWHIYPEPYRKKKNWINYVLELKTKDIIQKAWKVSFPSQLLMEYMATYFPDITKKGFVLPHVGCSLHSAPKEPYTDTPSLPKEKINIVHLGSLLEQRNPNNLIQAIIDLQNKHPWIKNEVCFLFIGTVSKKIILDFDKLPENILFYSRRYNYFQSLQFTNESDGALIIEADTDFSPFLPGKFADIAYLKKPFFLLTSDHSELVRIMGKDYAYKAPNYRKELIAEKLGSFITDIKRGIIEPKYADSAHQYVSIAANAEKIRTILK